MYSPIFESFYEDNARSGTTDQCINLFPEQYNTAKGLKVGLLSLTPGLTTPVVVVGTGPIRGKFAAANGMMYVVSGTKLYQVDVNWAVTTLGTIGSSTGPVSIIDSPTQILVVDGTGAWCYNFAAVPPTFVQVIPNAQTNAAAPNVAIYQDGFGIVNSARSNEIYQSNYNDLSLFASLPGPTANNAFVQNNPQNVLTMYDFKDEAWIFKQKAIEVWINQGNPGFSFGQLQGVSIPVGVDAPASIARVGSSLFWLGADDQGKGVVYQSIGYDAKPVSPFALSALFRSYNVTNDAIGSAYQFDAHFFYVLTFPSQNTSWGYDVTSGKWHQRAFFTGGQFTRELANSYCFFNGQNLVGDYRNGNIYALSESLYTDNGSPRKWLRSWRALPEAEAQGPPMSFDSLEIIMETGITTPAGLDPRIDLRFSDDGGYNWNGPFQMAAGKLGQSAFRVKQNRLGATTLSKGLDRIWEASGNDPMDIKILGAEFFGGPK